LQIYRKWLEKIGRPELEDIPYKTVREKCRVCEKHFTRADYVNKKLKCTSIPHLGKFRVLFFREYFIDWAVF